MRTTNPVPRSGCLATSKKVKPIRLKVMNVCLRLIGKGLLYKKEDKKIGKDIFIISDD